MEVEDKASFLEHPLIDQSPIFKMELHEHTKVVKIVQYKHNTFVITKTSFVHRVNCNDNLIIFINHYILSKKSKLHACIN